MVERRSMVSSAMPLLAAIAALAASSAGANTISVGTAAASLKVGGISCPYFQGDPGNGCDTNDNQREMVPGTVTPTLLTGTIDDTSHLFTTGFSSYLVASADQSGRMKIYGPPNPSGGVDPANAIGAGFVEGEAEVRDTLTFSGPTEADGLYHFTLNVHLDGTFSPVAGFDGTSNAPLLIGSGLVLNVFGSTPCLNNNNPFGSASSTVDLIVSVSCTTSASAIYDTDLDFSMRNLHADFSGTAAVYLDPLPPGVTVSSASGVFANSPVPEPGTLALFGAGLLGVCGASRRRRT